MSRTQDPYPPIASYALIGDCHSSGLVSADGSVDWACFRRFDAPSTFARILDWERGGFCSLAPVGSEPAGRAYMENTMILESEYRAGHARGRTTDFFAISYTSHAGEAERVHPYHQLIRIAQGISGTTEWEFICRPRFEYGIVQPRATLAGERLALLVGGPEALTVSSSVPLLADDGAVRATFRLSRDDRAWFALTRDRPEQARAEPLSDEEITHRLAYTCGFWREWAGLCSYAGPYREAAVPDLRLVEAVPTATGDLGG